MRALDFVLKETDIQIYEGACMLPGGFQLFFSSSYFGGLLGSPESTYCTAPFCYTSVWSMLIISDYSVPEASTH